MLFHTSNHTQITKRKKFVHTSGLFGATASARRKHSMALSVWPLILQKFPIWL